MDVEIVGSEEFFKPKKNQFSSLEKVYLKNRRTSIADRLASPDKGRSFRGKNALIGNKTSKDLRISSFAFSQKSSKRVSILIASHDGESQSLVSIDEEEPNVKDFDGLIYYLNATDSPK